MPHLYVYVCVSMYVIYLFIHLFVYGNFTQKSVKIRNMKTRLWNLFVFVCA